MKGIFKKRNRALSILWSAFFILSGTVIALRMGTWGIDAIIEGQIAEAIFCFGFVILGIAFGSMSILIFSFNRKALFETDGKKIKIVCNFSTSYDLDIDEISDVSLIGGHLALTTDSERITVSNLENAKEICEYLQKIVAPKNAELDFEKEGKIYADLCKKTLVRLIPTIICTALLFVHIGWCVHLTEGRELGDFTASDDKVFVAFAVAEVVTLASAFIFAKICGKVNVLREEARKRKDAVYAQLHRKDALEKYSGIFAIKYFDGGRYRIVIFSPNGDLFGYMLEYFDVKTEKWNNCYEKAKGFSILSDLYDDIEENFSDVIIED